MEMILCKYSKMQRFLCLFFLPMFRYVSCNTSSEWVKIWGDDFAREFDIGLPQNEKLKQIYLDVNPLTEIVNLEEILKQKINRLQDLFQSAEKKVEIIAEAAERIHSNFNKTNNLTGERVRFYDRQNENATIVNAQQFPSSPNSTLLYYNAKCGCGYQLPDDIQAEACYVPNGGFTSNEDFNGQDVTLSTSAVHIPLDVYNEAETILSDIAWTQQLDPIFKEQLCLSDSTKWLYVATNNGVLRYFPGRPWSEDCSKVDLHDARMETWFVQSISSPKDVLIMIDTSGSIIGLTLNLIKQSVRHLMNTLSRNDYFNIFTFNKEATFLNPDCTGLIQALPYYKNLAIEWLNQIPTPHNSSSFENGFDFAFQTLSNSTNNTRSMRSSCNPIILLLTDGGDSYPAQTFEKWNLQKHTRVFTYSVGKHFLSTGSLREMACNNRGQFSKIPSNSATTHETIKYLGKISKPLAYSNIKVNQWTLPYEDHNGLGVVLSVTRPVYDNEAPQLGVVAIVGVDVSYRDVKEIMDMSEYGVNAYSFGIENNGLLFHHPWLKHTKKDAPTTIDILDIEHSNFTELRTLMLYKEMGQESLSRIFVHRNHIMETEYQFAYSSLPDSVFSVAIGLPTFDLERYRSLNFNNIELETLYFNQSNVKTIVSGIQCRVRNSSSNNEQTCSSERNKTNIFTLNLEDISTVCGLENLEINQLNSLKLQGYITKRLSEFWLEQPNNAVVLGRFVITDSEPIVMRTMYSSGFDFKEELDEYLLDRDNIRRMLLSVSTTTYQVVKFDVPATYDDFTTTPVVTSQPGDDVLTVATETTESVPYLIASKPVDLNNQVPSVTGLLLDQEIMTQLLYNSSQLQCRDGINCFGIYNCQSQDRMCLLLDDAGSLISTNQEEHFVRLGEFFGNIDGDLFDSLERDNVYVADYFYDHQATCDIVEINGNAAPRIIPTIANLINIGWWATTSMYVSVQNFIFVLQSFVQAVSGSADIKQNKHSTVEVVEVKQKSCVLGHLVFTFGKQNWSQDGVVNCKDLCNRTYSATRIPASNLLFIVADTGLQCSSDRNFCYSTYKERVKDATNQQPCPSSRYRRNPTDSCFDASTLPEDLDQDCGAFIIYPQLTILSLVIALVLR